MEVLFAGLGFTITWSLLTMVLGNFLEYAELRHKGKAIPFTVDIRPITFTLTLLEVLGFATLTSFYVHHSGVSESTVTVLVAIIGGWFAIKSLTQRVRADDEGHPGLSQTEMRNRYIIETIFSLSGGVLLGYLLSLHTF